jgi:molybdopterin-guanine dinucleotide biosynthesis protein A
MQNTEPKLTPRINEMGAVVLCGGQSTRLGINKSELLLNGKTFLQTIVETLVPVAAKIVLVGNVDHRKHSLPPEVELTTDEKTDCGPLEGIRVGLKELAVDCEFAFVTSCDVPLLNGGLVTFLREQLAGHDGIVPFRGERRYGMTAIYRTSMHVAIEQRIEQAKLRVCDLTEGFNVKKIHADELRAADPELDSLTNVNSAKDYQRLLDRVAR